MAVKDVETEFSCFFFFVCVCTISELSVLPNFAAYCAFF